MGSMTIKDIAKICGVGVSTVSRAMNNHPDINPETKEMIKQVMKEHNYVPNNSARNLKRTASKTIAVLVKGVANPFFRKMIKILEQEITAKKYSFILQGVEETENEAEIALHLAKEKKLKGIIFLGGTIIHPEDCLENLDVPFVLSTTPVYEAEEDEEESGIGWKSEEQLDSLKKTVKTADKMPDNPSDNDKKESKETEKKNMVYATVSVDDRKESYKIVQYLCSLGHKKIGLLTARADDLSIGLLRGRGYLDALSDNGISYDESLVVYMSDDMETYSMQTGYDMMNRLLDRRQDFTAVYAVSDAVAIGACRAIFDRGYSVPEDFSVAGFDGLDAAHYYHPSITTISQPVEEMAKETIELLFQLIKKKKGKRYCVFEGVLEEGESTAGIAGEKKTE